MHNEQTTGEGHPRLGDLRRAAQLGAAAIGLLAVLVFVQSLGAVHEPIMWQLFAMVFAVLAALSVLAVALLDRMSRRWVLAVWGVLGLSAVVAVGLLIRYLPTSGYR